MIPMIVRTIFISAFFLVFSGFLGGSKQQQINASSDVAWPTHREVPHPPLVKSNDPLLLVGLEPYLGKSSIVDGASQEFTLKSNGSFLVLKDSAGIVHHSSEITLIWRKVALSHSKKFVRQVVGPFASFESANSIALQLKKEGIQSIVAHPKEWELWFPTHISLPKALKARSLEVTVNSEIKPFLKGTSGEVLLSGPIQIEAKEGLQWKGGVYVGPFLIQADAYGTWTFVEQVPLERYLHGVVPYEIGFKSPASAFAAQAVLARTWALANSKRFVLDGYHICSDTQCQVYKDPRKASEKVKRAILSTAGKVLTWQGHPIHAVYHASNGGVMASGVEAWSMAPVPYLRASLDGSSEWNERFALPLDTNGVKLLLANSDGPYGAQHRLFRWTRTFTSLELQENIKSTGNYPFIPRDVRVLKRGESGRVLALEINGDDNQASTILRLDNIRRTLRKLPSTLFVVNKVKDGVWRFSGGGFGHGAGLSQAGAIELALMGWTPAQILSHYYPGTIYGPLP